MLSLIFRNLKLYFRDRAGVFFSMLGPIIVFALYTVFLGNVTVNNLISSFPHADINKINNYVNAWVFAGILAIVPVTTSLAAIQVFVVDRAYGRFKDFAVSPIKPAKIVIAYLGSTFIISLIMTSIMFVITELYLVWKGGSWLSSSDLFGAIAILILLCAVFSALSGLIVTFIKSVSALSSINTIVGTLAGFLAAIYVPIGSLPKAFANILNTLPFSQGASLVRHYIASEPLTKFANGNNLITTKMNEITGMVLTVGDRTLNNQFIIFVLISLFFIFTIGAVLRISRKIG